MASTYDIGPQYEKDSCFTARMRFHQSWYRANRLQVPYGTGPKPSSIRPLGNMLTREHGMQGHNFLTTEIFDHAKLRMQEPGAVEPFRLQHNMLSSQPMCFNLFIPLAIDSELATRIFKVIIPDMVQVTSVKLEHAPRPPNQYIADRTAFDAFIEFTLSTGKLGFIGIETKLTEPFSQKVYDGPAYRRWSVLPDSPWPERFWSVLSDIEYNQLWRGHLLSCAMVKHEKKLYDRGYFMLLRHPSDTQCGKAADAYAKLLKSGDESFLHYDLAAFVHLAEISIDNEQADRWCQAFRDRYLHLALSEDEWQRQARRK